MNHAATDTDNTPSLDEVTQNIREATGVMAILLTTEGGQLLAASLQEDLDLESIAGVTVGLVADAVERTVDILNRTASGSTQHRLHQLHLHLPDGYEVVLQHNAQLGVWCLIMGSPDRPLDTQTIAKTTDLIRERIFTRLAISHA